MILGKKLYSRKNRIRNLAKVFKRMLPFFWKISIGRSHISNYSYTPGTGAPALTIVKGGELRCTSCLLCQNICPSHCIQIETGSNEEEKPPISFDINILRCTFCGLCEEACPVDAIRMDGPMPLGDHSESNWIWDKEYLKTYAGELVSKVGEERPLLPY